MPVKKTVKQKRIDAGYCSVCPDSTPIERKRLATTKDGTPARFCEMHLKYFRRYRKTWRAEHPEPKTQKCFFCREVGHNRNECQTPEAIAFREALAADGRHAN